MINMIYLFSFLAGLVLVLLQSLVIVVFVPDGLIYDLLIPLVVYLSLFHPNGKSLLLLLLLGLVMDGITGGAMGIYMLTYFWIFVGLQLAVHFFQKDSFMLMVTAIVLGVLLEYGLYLNVMALCGENLPVETKRAGEIIGRLVAAGFTGPLLFGALKTFYGNRLDSPGIS